MVGYYERKPIENESHSERKQAETEGTAKLFRKPDAPSASRIAVCRERTERTPERAECCPDVQTEPLDVAEHFLDVERKVSKLVQAKRVRG